LIDIDILTKLNGNGNAIPVNGETIHVIKQKKRHANDANGDEHEVQSSSTTTSTTSISDEDIGIVD